VTYADGHWIARVCEANGGTCYDVARIWSSSVQIYRAQATMEEGFWGPDDPGFTADFYIGHPQYMVWGDGFHEWPESLGGGGQDFQNYIRAVSAPPWNFCPVQYGADPHWGDAREWFAGTGGPICDWLLFPPYSMYLPVVLRGFVSPCSGAIQNGGFEAGLSPWAESSGNPPYPLVCDWANPNNNCGGGYYVPPDQGGAHPPGTWDAWLGGYNYAHDGLWQTVDVPVNLTSANLTFWRYIWTQETSGPYDYLRVQLRSSSGGWLTDMITLTDQTLPHDQWSPESMDISSHLTPYEGLQVQIYFSATTDLALKTSFFVDDVSLNLCSGAGQEGGQTLPTPVSEGGYPPPPEVPPPTPVAPGEYPPPPTPTPTPPIPPTPPSKSSMVVATVADLPTYSASSFVVSWSGSAPSGIADYDVQVCTVACDSPKNAVWTDWLTHTTATSHVYVGDNGVSYFFRCRARDHAGHVGDYPDWADTSTMVDALPPATTIEPLPLYTYQTSFSVQWNGNDNLSGLDYYDIYYRDESAANWTIWIAHTTATQATFSGALGHTYHFCSRGVDRVGNSERCPPISIEGEWPIQSDAHTSVAPGSRVSDLPPYTGSRTFLVSWSGSQGVQGYDVQVRDGLYGAWQTWKSNVPYTSASYTGQWGHIYYFRSRARQGTTWELWPYDYDTYTKLVEPSGLGGPAAPLEVFPPDEAPDRMEEVTRTQAIGVLLTGFIAPSGDLDWYRFELTATMRLRVKLYDLPADFDVYVFDGSGQFLWASTWGRTLPEEVVVRVPAGVYYVQLMGYTGDWSGETPYRLLVERAGQ
jgi:hypothetical protein